MSITKAAILTALNSRLLRAETNIDEHIDALLSDLSALANWPALFTSTTSDLVAGTSTITLPTDLKSLAKVTLNDGTYESEPLGDITFDQYLKNQAETTSGDRDEPLQYAKKGGKLYLDPVSDGSYTATIYYYKFHGDAATILFGDEFTQCIFTGVMMKYIAAIPGLQADSKYPIVRAEHNTELVKLLPSADYDPVFVQYHDV